MRGRRVRARRGRSRTAAAHRPDPERGEGCGWRPVSQAPARALPCPRPRSGRGRRRACAIFVPDGVTRWLNSRATRSRSPSSRPASARSRCSSTIRSAPPSSASVVARSTIGAALALDLPEPLEHELEVWRLDAALAPPFVNEATPGRVLLDPAGGDLVEHGLDELVLGVTSARQARRTLAAALRSPSARQRASGGRGGGRCRTAREPTLERVEVGERVVTDAEQNVHRQIRSRQHVLERAGERAAVTTVVEEVLLHLVEDQVELAAGGDRALRERVGERNVGRRRPRQRRSRGSGRRARCRRSRPRRRPRVSAGPPERAIADAALPRPAAASSCRRRSGRRAR